MEGKSRAPLPWPAAGFKMTLIDFIIVQCYPFINYWRSQNILDYNSSFISNDVVFRIGVIILRAICKLCKCLSCKIDFYELRQGFISLGLIAKTNLPTFKLS